MTWAISRKPLRPGALVTAGDVCHLHPDRAAAERCGALMGGDPDLVRLEKHTARVYRVLWSLSDMAGGELRKPAPRRDHDQRRDPVPFGAGQGTSA